MRKTKIENANLVLKELNDANRAGAISRDPVKKTVIDVIAMKTNQIPSNLRHIRATFLHLTCAMSRVAVIVTRCCRQRIWKYSAFLTVGVEGNS